MPRAARRTAERQTPARSLADDLRRRADAELVALVLARPDLARPAPADLTALAARAGTRPSVQRVVERLDAGAVVILRALAGHADPRSTSELVEALDATPGEAALVERGIERLRRLGLVWGGPAGWHLVRVVEQVLAAAPGAPGSPGEPGSGATAARPASALTPPAPATVGHEQNTVDRVAGVAARDLLGQLDELVELWSHRPPRVLRSGGLGVRDLAVAARALDVPTEHAAWILELALAAGLVADDGDVEPAWAPTPEGDAWGAGEAPTRWAALAHAWLGSSRAAYLVGRPVSGTRAAGTIAALGPDAFWPPVRALRADVLGELGALPPGHGITPGELLEQLAWRRPLRDPRSAADAAHAVLREATWLGLVGLDALTSAGRVLAGGFELPGRPDPTELAPLARAMAPALPAAVDHVLLQADLTIIAPGPADGELGRFLRLVADVESRGGATVSRLSATSVRRALDAGWVADDILGALARFSRTAVPQPVDYLVRDAARRHGQTRIGGATAYLRSDDEAALAALLADRALAPAQLRRIAPTVLISRADPATVLRLLREAGHAPVQEGLDGGLVLADHAPHRARPRRPRSTPAPTPAPVDEAFAAALVAAVRSAPPRPPVGTAPAGVLATDPATTATLLRRAAADGLAVWIGYADANGRTTRHLVRPVRIDAGRMYAVSGESAAEQVYLLHRITGAAAS